VHIVVTLGLLAIALAGVAILAQRAPRRAGTNLTADVGNVVPLAPGRPLCQPAELVPGDTSALRLSASSAAPQGPRLTTTIYGAHGAVSSGTLAAGWRAGIVSIPVARIKSTLQDALVCVADLGSRPIALGGSVPDGDFYVVVAGKPLSGRLRIEYLRPGRESWLALLPTLVHRFSLAKADAVRHWAAGAVIVLMLVAIVLAARTMLKEETIR
jgi:hypothetical protein